MNDNFENEEELLLTKAAEMLACKQKSSASYNCAVLMGKKCPLLCGVVGALKDTFANAD